MKTQREPRDEPAKSIFLDALEIASTQDRLVYLDRRCGRDAALRAEVETLLRHHEGLGDYLEGPALGAGTTRDAAPRPLGEGPGTVIGPYKLLQEIGEGGMGAVYMAEQEHPIRRKVALKLIKPGMDSRQVLARFEAERQALALMDHPNIARVLDAASTGSGHPYFVMELVKGVPITTYCDKHHLAPRERLELFVPVCQAVQHAHQKGIIHRDLKPSNVLVAQYDGRPVPKVIDFGVAKATGPRLTEATLFTGFGSVVGTLEYMSPEQAELNQLDVDTRSDVYSLGVLLYELLTGTTPLQRTRLREPALLEALRVIREEEPTRPSTRLDTTEELPAIAANRGMEPKRLSGLVRGELDWIVMKCLEKERGRRHESAGAFAADLQRYLADEPVQACPPSAGSRFRKFARRNKAALATAATLTAGVLVAVGSLVAAVSVLAASNAEVKAEQKQTNAAPDREKQTNDALLRALDREQRALYSQRIALAEREVEARNLGRPEELLEQCPDPLRGWEWHHQKRRCRQAPLTFREHRGPVVSVAVSALSGPGGDLSDSAASRLLRSYRRPRIGGNLEVRLVASRPRRAGTAPSEGARHSPGSGTALMEETISMADVTHLLSAIEQGDPRAADQLLPLVYDELRRLAARKLAHEAPGQTLQATALVHEAYLRLVGGGQPRDWSGRGHFFAAAAEAMRRILVDNARRRKAEKRGGDRARQDPDAIDVLAPEAPEDLVALDEALNKLAATDKTAADLVELRFFAGLAIPEAAKLLGISPRTADRLWAYARAWLHQEVRGRDPLA